MTYNFSPAQTPAQETVHARFTLGGEIGRRLNAVTHNWILPLPAANPKILEMFRDRDRLPYQSQMPWAGEFAGKYLTHAVQIYRLTRDPKLAEHLKWFVAELVSLQDEDGYLGPWPHEARLKAEAPNGKELEHWGVTGTWDAWGHYHIMIGLLLWHVDQGDQAALACCVKMADYFCERFLDNPSEKLHDCASHEMNQAPVHSLCLLHELTGNPKYLALAEQIVSEFEIPPAGDYLRTALAGMEFYETPKPRWESLHPIMSLSELYYITGDDKYRRAFEHLWWSMLRGDRHNTGGFSSGEKATGDPYDEGAIETCCTIAWMAMSVEMLRLTGSSVVADELEFSTLNSGVGMMSPSGRWVTYNTPMSGVKEASAHTIVFQARAGTPELNCCSVNGPRALGLIAEWAVMRRSDGVALNYYGPGEFEFALPSGNALSLAQETAYPNDGRISVAVSLGQPETFPLFLRIPSWSEQTSVTVNGESITGVGPGSYLEIRREWTTGDKIEMLLDFRPHFWVRDVSPEGVARVSVYRGPILLAFDPAYGTIDLPDMPALDAASLDLQPIAASLWMKPLALYAAKTTAGGTVNLCDYASAGMTGSRYETWLPATIAADGPAEFTRERPMRTVRPAR